MNTHTKFTAITMVAVITLSLFTAIAATPTIVEAHTASFISLTASTTTPIIGQSVTFTVTLVRWSATTHTWVRYGGRSISILHWFGGVQYVQTKTTNAAGQIIFTQAYGSAGIRTYKAAYAGDSVYAASTSGVVTVSVQKIPTTLTLTPSTYNPYFHQTVTLSGVLKNSAGRALAGKHVGISSHVPGGAEQFYATATTGIDGTYSTKIPTDNPTTIWTAYFVTDSAYAGAVSTSVAISAQKSPTNFNFHQEPSRVHLGTQLTVTGTVTGILERYNGVSWVPYYTKTPFVMHTVILRDDGMEPGAGPDNVYVDTNGRFSYTWTYYERQPGTLMLWASWKGDTYTTTTTSDPILVLVVA